MYINNTTKKPIRDVTFEGFYFTIPAGVSLVWDKFGEFIENLYKVSGENGGMPPVIIATSAQWKGEQYAEVRRFELNSELIPNRAQLIKLGKSRGVDAATIELWKEDEEIDNREIANTINELAVPDVIRFPEPTETEETAPAETEKMADDLIAGGAGTQTPAGDDKKKVKAPKVTAPKKIPSTQGAGKAKAGDTKKKVAVRTPATPRPQPGTPAAK